MFQTQKGKSPLRQGSNVEIYQSSNYKPVSAEGFFIQAFLIYLHWLLYNFSLSSLIASTRPGMGDTWARIFFNRKEVMLQPMSL
jgi:hypothetical protein